MCVTQTAERPNRRGVRTTLETRERRRNDVALRYPQGVTDEEFAAAWGVSKTTIAKDRRARGVAARPSGRRPESPLPELRICEAEGCEKEFRPTRNQVKEGWGRFCSKACMATDPVRREASSRWVTAKNAERREELAKLANAEELTPEDAARDLGVSLGELQYYERQLLLVPRRVTAGGLTRRLYSRSDLERFKREWRRGGDYRRAQWLNEGFLFTVYEGRGWIEKFTAEKTLTADEARDILRGRLQRRLASYPLERRGRKPTLPKAEWAEMFTFLKVQLHEEFEARALGDKPPTDWDIASHVAVLDSSAHPERWLGYRRADGELDPARSDDAAERVWKAIKPLVRPLN